MRLWVRGLVTFGAIWLAGCGSPPPAGPQAGNDKPSVAAEEPKLRQQPSPAHQPGPDTEPVRAAVERVEQLDGRIERDQSDRVIGVDLPECQADDDDLRLLGTLTGLQRLRVWSTWITDKGLQHLNGFPELRRLHLLFANLTDDGMVQLTRIIHD